MRRTIIEIYALSVCFFSVACLAITAGVALYDLVQIAAPSLTLNADEYERHQSNEAFEASGGARVHSVRVLSDGRIESDEPAPAGTDITKARKQSLDHAISVERRRGGHSLLRAAIILFVACVVFMLHWSLASRNRQRASD